MTNQTGRLFTLVIKLVPAALLCLSCACFAASGWPESIATSGRPLSQIAYRPNRDTFGIMTKVLTPLVRPSRPFLSAKVPSVLDRAYSSNHSSRQSCPSSCRCIRSYEIRCRFQQLDQVPRDLPSGFTKINLSYNKLKVIPPEAFTKSKATLRSLFLQSNEIETLRGPELAMLRNLESLRLSWNQISAIFKMTVRSLTGLTRLYLDHNKINFIHPHAFRGLTKLKLLQLEGNKLSQLHPDTFVTIRFSKFFSFSHVQFLYLSDNQFQVLPHLLLEQMSSLRQVFLHGNPWECSCHMQWLHQWMRESGKHRCKQSVFGGKKDLVCPVCATPFHLEDQDVVRMPLDNLTCLAPSPKVNHPGAATEKFTIDSTSLELMHEQLLFRIGRNKKVHMSLRLDGQMGPLVSVYCDATQRPTTIVTMNVNANYTYIGLFEVPMECTVEHPESADRLNKILMPYLHSALLFTRTDKSSQPVNGHDDYTVEIQGEPFEPLAPAASGLRIESASLLESSPVLKSRSSTLTIVGSKFYPELRKLGLLFQTTVEYEPGEESSVADEPWTMLMKPAPTTIDSALALKGKTVVLKCKAMGYPRTSLSWVTPQERVLRIGRRNARIRVTRRGQLLIRGVASGDAGIYRCLSQSRDRRRSVAKDIGSVRLHVIDPTDSISRPLRRSATVGEEWRATCSINAVPHASIAWRTPDDDLLIGEASIPQGPRTFKNGSLLIKKVQHSHSGQYSCLAMNGMGIATLPIYLEVSSEEQEIVENEIDTDYYDGYGDDYGSLSKNTTETTSAPSEEIILPPKSMPPNISSNINGDEKIRLTVDGEDVDGGPSVAPVMTEKPSSGIATAHALSTTEVPVDHPSMITTVIPLLISTSINSPEQPAVKVSDVLATVSDTRGENSSPVSSEIPAGPQIIPTLLTDSQHSNTTPPSDKSTFSTETVSTTGTTTSPPQSVEQVQEISSIGVEAEEVTEDQQVPDAASTKGPKTPAIFEPKKIIRFLEIQSKPVTDVSPKSDDSFLSHAKFAEKNLSTDGHRSGENSNNVVEIDKQPTIVRPDVVPVESSVKFSVVANTTSLVTSGVEPAPTLITQLKIQQEDGATTGIPKERFLDSEPSGELSSTVELQQTRRKETRQVVEKPIQANYGESLTISCPAPSKGRQDVIWSFQGNSSLNSETTSTRNLSSLLQAATGSNLLVIEKLDLRHNGIYSCSASYENFEVIHNIQVDVQTSPPRFINMPDRQVAVNYGESTAIACNAAGIPNPAISWSWPQNGLLSPRAGGGTSIYTDPDNVLHLQNVVPDFGVMFLCSASNVAGKLMKEIDIRVVSAAPKIASSLQTTYTVVEGRSAVLDCQASAIPLARYSWTLPDGQVMNSSAAVRYRKRISSNGSLTLETVAAQDAGTYRCAATNAVGESFIDIKVYVQAAEEKFHTTDDPSKVNRAKEKVASTTSSTDVTTSGVETAAERTYRYNLRVMPEDVALMNCQTSFTKSYGRRNFKKYYNRRRISVAWQLPSGDKVAFPSPTPSWRHRALYNGVLRIRDVDMADKGLYICTATHRNGRIIRTEARLIVEARRAVIQQLPFQTVISRKDRSAGARCNLARGSPKAHLHWTTPDGRVYTPGSWGRRLYVKRDGQLVIRSMAYDMIGRYTCTARNIAGNVTRTVYFQMQAMAPKIRSHRYERKYVRLSHTARMTCSAIGVPSPSISWTAPNGNRILQNVVTMQKGGGKPKLIVTSSGTLVLSRAAFSDNGLYRCYARNAAGVAIKNVKLQVYR